MAETPVSIQLKKHEEQVIDASSPWKGDCLERAKAGEILGRILRTIEQPFVVAINAPFGMGKSFFVKRLLQQFRNEGQVALYFNAWEKDNQSQPLLSFVGELQSQFDEHYGIKKSRKSIKKLTKSAGAYTVRKLLPGAARIATAGLIGGEEIKELGRVADELISGAGSLAEGLVQQQIETEKAQITFRNDLEQAAADALKQAGDSAQSVYIFVDELDRCRPPYALELLENIKHLFSVPGLVFILSIDRAHLKNSISTIYGSGMDGEGYLARFIDQNFQLPEPRNEAFSEFLYKRFGLDSVLSHRNDGYSEKSALLESFAEFATLFGLSLRHQEQAFAEINFVVRNAKPNQAIFAPLLGQLAALKRYDHHVYERYCMGQLTWDDMKPFFRGLPAGKDWLEQRDSESSRAWMIAGNQLDSQKIRAVVEISINRLNEISNSGTHSPELVEERRTLERTKDLFSDAFEISTHLSRKYGLYRGGGGKTPAGYLYDDLGLASDFEI